jgi:hydrogen peroxide-dependent heme synthase
MSKSSQKYFWRGVYRPRWRTPWVVFIMTDVPFWTTDVPFRTADSFPPETVEGWYTLHQIFRIVPERREEMLGARSTVFEDQGDPSVDGWSTAVRLIGSTADVMFVHFRPTLDGIGMVQQVLAREGWMRALVPTYAFLSVTEAGLYHMTSELAQAAEGRGGRFGDEEYVAAVRARVDEERKNPHTRRRLYPPKPEHMPYVCFYPMSKRREAHQNWYRLSLAERSLLMRDHGMTGRKYAGRVQQVITGAIGLDAWEWGVTLFAADPLEFKKLVTEMRFDEVSATYAEFGEFYVGRMGGLGGVIAGG